MFDSQWGIRLFCSQQHSRLALGPINAMGIAGFLARG
jgi:hypothetical protein